MPYIRIIPAVIVGLLFPLVCRGQGAAPPQTPPPAPAAAPVPEGPTAAEIQLDAATIKVRLMKQIAASIDQEVEMLNQSFKLEGKYFKDFTKDFKVRLQLKLVGLGDTGSTMLQVCDGKVLWDYQRVLKTQSYRKKEIVPIMKRLDESNLDIFVKSFIITKLGFGGPEAMMIGLRKAVKFDTVTPETIDGVEVLVLGGEWIDRSRLLGPGDRPLPPTAPLPPYVPSRVRIYIGKENGWPYRIVMTGNKPSMVVEEARSVDTITGRPIGVKKAPPKVDPTKITLEYKLLPLSEITPGLFEFQPPADLPSTSVNDETGPFLQQLDAAIQDDTNRKKAEAAKAGEDPILKTKPLEVGTPQPDTSGPDTFPTPGKTTPK